MLIHIKAIIAKKPPVSRELFERAILHRRLNRSDLTVFARALVRKGEIDS
jgi:hypothetical protein